MKYFFFALLLSGCHLAPSTSFIEQLRRDAQAHPECSQTVAGYVDLQRADNHDRFFLVELRTGRVLVQAPCLNGLTDAQNRVRYSNRVNSNCSSRGLARIGRAYAGGFGRAYRLHGLEASNSNLRRRSVVLHSWAGVAAVAGGPHPIQSQGCPTLNPDVLARVARVVDAQAQPVLLRLH